MCSSKLVTWSLVSQTQSPLQEGCIQFYYSSTPSYNERCPDEEWKCIIIVNKLHPMLERL